MALKTYRDKRKFKVTSEPYGEAQSKIKRSRPLKFVIQKHAARRLHYDLRLEHHGVLKSWAVPKGPSLIPKDKRLAVEVEDHPIEYGDFEGTIPKGEYGAGEVIIWDRGSWIPIGSADNGFKSGKLEFELKGEKLKGKWKLIRMKQEKGKNQWLLMKAQDEEARSSSSRSITEEKPDSVVDKKKITRKELSSSVQKESLPEFIAPQLATRADSAPLGNDWIHETKYDGYRVIARIENKKISLISRNRKDWSKKYSKIAESLRLLPVQTAILDGEVVIFESDGKRTSFQSLQNLDKDPAYCIFDILHLNGYSLRSLPLMERKKILSEVLKTIKIPDNLLLTEYQVGGGDKVFAKACKDKLEGIISKEANSNYISKRSRSWLKIKCEEREEFVIGGYLKLRKKDPSIGALLLGTYDKTGNFTYCGKVGTGFDTESRKSLFKELSKLNQKESPFDDELSNIEKKDVFWTKPKLVAEIRFTERTTDGRLRHPKYEGLRLDKEAKSVHKEEIINSNEEGLSNKKLSKFQLEGVTLTNPDRLLFQAEKITKFDLAKYFQETAEYILADIRGRLLSVVRCPDGYDKGCFFQKHPLKSMPSILPTHIVKEAKKKGTYIYVTEVSHLIALAQMSCIELHTWGSQIPDIDTPNRIIFDLDPGEKVSHENLIESVFITKQLLEHFELQSFLKTTGGKGFHLIVPIKPLYTWETVRILSEAIAKTLVAENPTLFVAVSTKSKRTGKIYCDYLRNSRSATAIGNYSPRARPRATVSVPLEWSELTAKMRSDAFTIKDVSSRLKKKPNVWGDLEEKRQKIPKKLLKGL